MTSLVRGTRVALVDGANPDPAVVAEGAEVLVQGGLVAFPTETVYGLGANALNGEAVAKIFVAKGRPADNPLIVHVADRAAVEQIVAELPSKAVELMERFWPGPLTLVLPRKAGLPDAVTAGLSAVGVRMPNHPVALELIRRAGVPIAAPSANLSGRPSPTSAEHVLDDLAGRIDFVLDAGSGGMGLESTVLDLTTDPPVLLRPGGVTLEQLRAVLGTVQVDTSVQGDVTEGAPRSPGMKYTHYAPNATVILVEGPVLHVEAKIRDLAHEYAEEGKRVGIMCAVESRGAYHASVILEYGSRENLASVASDLFGTLRAFDRHGVEVVLAEGVTTEGIGLAIMNRLRRAAGCRVVSV